MNLGELRKSIIKHEGLKLKPYKCPADKWTIGVGRNLEDVGITEKEALYLLDNDIDRCVAEIGRNITGWKKHSEVRQNVLIEMVFNLGISRLLKFRKMLEALDHLDYETAAAQMQDSLWYIQVGQRAKTLCQMMRTGEWPE